VNFQTSHIFTGLEAGNYHIEVRDANGCSIIYGNNPVVLEGLPPVPVTIEAISGTDACIGGQVILEANADNAASYTWSTGQTGSAIVVSSEAEGFSDYSCVVMNNEGCSGSETISIDYHSGPTVDFTVESEEENFCMGMPVTIDAYSSEAVSYEWKTDSLTGSQVEYTSDVAGTVYYPVTATNVYGCKTVDSVSVEFTDCSLAYEDLIIDLYPNPTSGKFTLVLTGVREDITIEIIDFIGQEVLKERIINASSYIVKKEFDLSVYEDAVYFIRVIHSEKVYNERVIVQ
jgi:hypothetical protein